MLNALSAMAGYRQFILWKLAEREGKQIKLPISAHTVDKCDPHDPTSWVDMQTAIAAAKLFGPEYGIGFVFTAADPFFFVDVDKCKHGDEWSPLALQIVSMFPGAAVEISQSGTGLHIFGQATVPPHSCKNIALGIEFYTESRFVALTGIGIIGNVATDHTAVMNRFVAAYFPPREFVTPEAWTTTPVAEWNGIIDDDELISKALASKSAASAFGARASFADLWNRNVEVLADVYTPDSSDRDQYDESSADAALAQHLAFWTGKDCERIQRLMMRSSLVRDKWKRDDYIRGTIMRAVSLQKEVFRGRVSVTPPTEIFTADLQVMTGFQFLGATQQIDHFKGCTYIQNTHRIFTAAGTLLRPDQFNATFGGYVFQLDSEASGKTTRKAWEAFTESQVVRFPKAEIACFKPDQPTGTLIKHEGRLMVNTYVDITTPRIVGDVSRFLAHLAKLIPNERDRTILVSYMAACVQYKGVKFQWCPLIQGAEGNGKTLFTRVLMYALGERFTHLPRADEIGEKFNAWLFGKLFIGIEDIYVPEHKREIMEIIKPMITGDRLACRAMQTDQFMMENLANFVLNSNYKDAVRKLRNDRRFSIFYTAQQTEADIISAGMSGNYFPKLYQWLKHDDGYAIIADFLDKYQIPDEFNPATSCHRAPVTTSTNEAIFASMGAVEQEIIEAIDEQRVGFAGGWISSKYLDKLLEGMRRNIPRNKRREILQSLGYDWHPGLKDGRVNNIINADEGKPRLFIREGHSSAHLINPAEIARQYAEAQTEANSHRFSKIG